MKNYALLFFLALSIVSCTLKDDFKDLDKETAIGLLTAHKWHGVKATRYLNDKEQSSQDLSKQMVTFNTERDFIKTVNGVVVIDGNWHWMDNPEIPTVMIQYPSPAGSNQNEIYELKINILTDDYLEYSIYDTDANGQTIRDDYFFQK